MPMPTQRLPERGYLKPMAKKRKPSTSAFSPALFPYIQQASDDTLHSISRFDYGMEA